MSPFFGTSKFAMMEEREAEFILANWWISGYPSPSRSIGIVQLAEDLKVIYGAQ